MFEVAIMCLALNIYYEARSEPLAGKIAVAEVVLNRVIDTRYPNTICEVVKQGPTYKYKPNIPIRNRCQFSWYCDGKSDKPTNKKAFDNAKTVAKWVATRNTKNLINLVEGATHYHATYVMPEWASTKTFIVRINKHIFYKWEK